MVARICRVGRCEDPLVDRPDVRTRGVSANGFLVPLRPRMLWELAKVAAHGSVISLSATPPFPREACGQVEFHSLRPVDTHHLCNCPTGSHGSLRGRRVGIDDGVVSVEASLSTLQARNTALPR